MTLIVKIIHCRNSVFVGYRTVRCMEVEHTDLDTFESREGLLEKLLQACRGVIPRSGRINSSQENSYLSGEYDSVTTRDRKGGSTAYFVSTRNSCKFNDARICLFP